MRIGIDIGSTTIKCVVLDDQGNLIHKSYERHFAMITEKTKEVIRSVIEKFHITESVVCAVSGSAGMGLAEKAGLPFVQEVYATKVAMSHRLPDADVVIELGGEDAKILFLKGNLEVRMNGTCAGGTGAFADQMASLMQIDTGEMNELAKQHGKIYSIASRCGVFAKTDIQPLLNQGARKEDISASIYQAVVNQTISGLACGKPIRGNVAFLGGPLHFLSELRGAFIRTLNLTDEQIIAPDHSHLFAAVGAAMNAKEDVVFSLDKMIADLSGGIKMEFEVKRMEPLFKDEAAYKEFTDRHAQYRVKRGNLAAYEGNCFLGIDAGSTTTKIALVGEDGSLLYNFYSNNNGSPMATAIAAMKEIKSLLPPTAKIAYSCSTGYGEALLKAAFLLDEGEVETISHYYAAAFFNPDVDCILDIGGQDMKCIRIKDGTD